VIVGWLDAAKSELPRGSAHDAVDVALRHARVGHSVARRAIGAEVDDGNVTRSALSVARDAMIGVSKEAQRANVRVLVEDCAENDLLVISSPVAQQILVNLLLNAVQFSPPRSTVTLTVGSVGAQMRFRVKDNGPGIAAERIASLFQAAESTRRGGAGIGLRHSFALAEAHGGRLGLAFTGSLGSEFELLWPTGDAPSRTHRTIPPQSLDGARVLLLDDDPAIQALVDLGLTARGATVATATSRKELLQIMENGVFDVALLDLSPLGDDPVSTITLLAERQRDLPVVIISGSAAPTLDAPNIAAWVRKPFEIRELAEALSRVRSL
jgi:CheY-like chemotaxis protein